MKSKNNNESKSEFSYKETLNLLKTEFSMRANSVMREPEIQKFWSTNNIDLRFGSNNTGKTFLVGSNGRLTLNKSGYSDLPYIF